MDGSVGESGQVGAGQTGRTRKDDSLGRKLLIDGSQNTYQIAVTRNEEKRIKAVFIGVAHDLKGVLMSVCFSSKVVQVAPQLRQLA